MELHVLPPAFGLPSIDAECIAAVALLQLRHPGKYEVVPTHNQRLRLPYLVEGQEKVSGFNNIERYLATRGRSDGKRQSEVKTSPDSLALISLVESNATPLLDLSLYVSFENYRHVTRPAFTKALPWYANYILPPQKRMSARTRTEHLSISSIDIDNVHDDMSNRPQGFEGVGKENAFEAETQKRASLLLPQKETVRSLLQRPEHAAVFRLHALADAFFGPLEDMFGEQKYFSGLEDEPDSVDCLVYGYLSLMLFPQLPQDWLASTMRRKYAKLASFTQRMHDMLHLETVTDHILDLSKCKTRAEVFEARKAFNMSVAWNPPASTELSETLGMITSGIIDHVPMISSPTHINLLGTSRISVLRRHYSTILLTATASLAAFGYMAVHTGVLVWPHGDEMHIFGRKRLADYGHLGAALAGIGYLGQHTT